MTRYMARIATLVIATAFAMAAHAQNCDSILKHGVFDVSTKSTKETLARDYFEWLCSHESATYEEAKQQSAQAGFVLPDLPPVTVGGSSASQNYSSWRKDLCYSKEQRERYAKTVAETVIKANPDLINAWVQCVTRKGLVAWVDGDADPANPDRHFFKTEFRPIGSVMVAKVEDFRIEGGVCTSKLPTTVKPAGRVLTCKRSADNKDGAVLYALNTTEGNVTAIYPAKPVIVVPPPNPTMRVLVHIQNLGDIVTREGEWGGTMGNSLRLEGFAMEFSPAVPNLGIEYMCHIQNGGDTQWMAAGQFCGTRGQQRRVEGFQARLTGVNAAKYDLSYECHIENLGNSGLLVGGQFCGTRGQSRRIEALRVIVTAKNNPSNMFVAAPRGLVGFVEK